MRDGCFGERVERAPAALAMEAQKSVRAAPPGDLAARAMRTALGLDAFMAGRYSFYSDWAPQAERTCRCAVGSMRPLPGSHSTARFLPVSIAVMRFSRCA
jgi:hypothetical protein